jgi:hypothetical protein
MADKKMSQLEELGTLNSYDIMHIVTDPTNNAVNRKGTIQQHKLRLVVKLLSKRI